MDLKTTLSAPKLVKITHFINPSRFYCRDMSQQNEELAQVKFIEDSLQDFMISNPGKLNDFFDPKPTDVVAFFQGSRFIRCQVDYKFHTDTEKILILWAVDYGLPLYVKNFQAVVPLPAGFRYPRSKVFVASLSCLPATLKFDHENCKQISEFSPYWSKRAISVFRKEINSASEIYFTRSTDVSHPEVLIGDLVIYDKSIVKYGMISKLLEEETAVIVPNENFLKCYNQLFTNNIERWNDNERTGGVLKNVEGTMQTVTDTDNILGSLYEDSPPCSISKVIEWLNENKDIKKIEVERSDSGEDMNIIDELPYSHQISYDLNRTPLGDEVSEVSILTKKQLKQNNTSDGISVRKMIFLPAGAALQQTVITRESYNSTNDLVIKTGEHLSKEDSKSTDSNSCEISKISDWV